MRISDWSSDVVLFRSVPNVCALGSYLTSGSCHATPTPPDPSFAETQANKFTYKVTAKYNFTPDINVYATYSTGYKGPMISYPANPPQQTVRPETVEYYELGFKSLMFNNRVVFNAALYNKAYK